MAENELLKCPFCGGEKIQVCYGLDLFVSGIRCGNCKSHTGCEGCPLTDDKGCKLMPRSDIPWVNVNIVFWCVKRADVEWLEAVIVDG